MNANAEEVLKQVAADFGGAAQNTILFENWFKHLLELELIVPYLSRAGSLVDVGGGVGVNLLCLRALGYTGRLTLIDRFAEYDENNRMGPQHAARTRLERADIEVLESNFWPKLEIPAEDASFDVATSFDVLEHLPGNPIQHLTEIRRVLKPGGAVVAGAPNAAGFMHRVDLALRGKHPYAHFDDWMREPYYEHYREYTPREYREILARSGFRVMDQQLSSAVPRARARKRYHNRKHSWFSPTPYALYGILAFETMLPGTRHTVYTIGRKA